MNSSERFCPLKNNIVKWHVLFKFVFIFYSLNILLENDMTTCLLTYAFPDLCFSC